MVHVAASRAISGRVGQLSGRIVQCTTSWGRAVASGCASRFVFDDGVGVVSNVSKRHGVGYQFCMRGELFVVIQLCTTATPGRCEPNG